MKSTVFVGVDLHKESLTVCVMHDVRNRDFHTMPTKCRNSIATFFTILGRQYNVVATVESVGFYHWFWDLVEPLVAELYLADASRVRAAAGRRAKTDHNDAETLARLLCQDSVPTAFVPDVDLRELRNLVRHRERLRRRVSSCKCSLRMEMNKLNLRGPKDLTTSTLHKWFLAQFRRLSRAARLAIKHLGDQLKLFENQLLEITETIERLVIETPRFNEPIQRLMTIPGIGLITAAVIYAETGGLDRFDREKEVVCYAGLAPRTFQSADNCRHGRIGKDGPPIMRRCLVQAAWVAVRCNELIAKRFEQYRRSRSKKKAIVKLAAKMLGWAWAMEKKTTTFDERRLAA